jgi:hypothetical protein
MSKMRVYAAGGAAINIVSKIYRPAGMVHEDGFADMEIAFIDTSVSNMLGRADPNFYKVEGAGEDEIEGSGKERLTNYVPIKAAMPEFLHKFPAGDLNVIVHSASGGSGATAGPVIATELLKQDKQVIVITIGSTGCIKEIKNTISTLRSYAGISKTQGKPVVAQYLENGQAPMSENDETVRMTILLLAAVWSGQNHGLDRKDLEHFINYTSVTEHAAALTALKIKADGKIDPPPKGQAVSSVVTLVREGEDPSPGLVVGYHAYGHFSPAAAVAIKVPTPLHLTTRQGYFSAVLDALSNKLTEAEAQYKIQTIRAVDVHDGDDLGMTF